MKRTLVKLPLFLLLAALSALAVTGMILTKASATANIVKTTQFAFARVEARQSLVQLEYGIKYGKQLEYYFNIDEVLQKVRASSSYIRNVYITNAAGRQLYAAGQFDLPLLSQLQESESGIGYQMYAVGTDELLSMAITPIEGKEPAGHMILRLSAEALSGLTEREHEKSALQSYIIGAFGLMLALIILTRLRIFQNARFRFVLCACFIVGAVLLPQAADTAIEVWRTNEYVTSAATSSAQRMAQTMQKQIDIVTEKGVAYSRISGLDAFFEENVQNIASVERFYLDAANTVSVEPSMTYIRTLASKSNRMFLELIAYEAIWGALLIAASAAASVLVKRIGEKKGGGKGESGKTSDYGEGGQTGDHRDIGGAPAAECADIGTP